MAVENKMASTLRLVLYEGEDMFTGKPIYKFKSFNNVKVEANAEQLYAVATAFSGLQQRDLDRIERTDRSEIEQN